MGSEPLRILADEEPYFETPRKLYILIRLQFRVGSGRFGNRDEQQVISENKKISRRKFFEC